MKKIYIVMVALLFSVGAFAQIQGNQKIKLLKPHSMPSMPINSARAGTSQIWLDYDSADAFVFGTPDSYYIWAMNKDFSLRTGDTLLNYCIVRFDSLYDVNTNTSISNSAVSEISVDSIYTFLGHENTSGLNDTLITRIINLDASGYPGTATLWADTTVVDTSLSPAGDWYRAQYLQWNPAYSHAMKSFGIELDYYGDRMDTCGFLAGYNNQGVCGTISSTSASLSNFYPNSFAYWMADSALIPTASGEDFYYDCNNNGQYDKGVDGNNFIQDILIGAWITINPLGFSENLKNIGIGLYQNVPNPLHSSTEIKYELANNSKEVTLIVYDIVGNKVMEVNEGSKASGKYTIELDATKLAKGMYTYTLRADGSQLTKRMIVE